MRKLLFIAIVLAIMASCAGNRSSEKTRQDSIFTPDSLAPIETALEDEQALKDSIARETEQAKLDSIRLDSIAHENNMRLTTSIFWSYAKSGRNEKQLKKLGFKKIKEKHIPDEEGIDEYEAIYSRMVNGRRIDYVDYQESCCSETIIFYDDKDREAFIQQLKKEGFKRHGSEYSHPNKYYPIVISGNKAELINCG